MPQIYDMGPTALLPLRRKAASAGFEPTNLGTKGQHATPRPPKPIEINIHEKKNCSSNWLFTKIVTRCTVNKT